MSSTASWLPTSLYSWRVLPRRLGYLLTCLLWPLTLGIVVVVLVAVGLPLSVIAIGVPILLLGLLLARGYGALELALLRWAGMPPLTPPTWQSDRSAPLGTRVWRQAVSPDAWRAVAFSALSILVMPISWGLTLAFSVLTLAFPAQLVQVYVIPRFLRDDESQSLGELLFSLMSADERASWRIGPEGLDLLIGGIASLMGLAVLPLIAGAFVTLHHVIARGLLARRASDGLRAQVQELTTARRAATEAEGRTLRQLERDLHDGPQQQLLRLQLDLEAAQRRLESDPESAAELLGEARSRAQETLGELRQLSRGIAPPLLQDRGLAAAVVALAERSPIPTSVAVAESATDGLDPAVAQGAYFVVSELLANAAKHAGARNASVTIARGPVTGTGDDDADHLVVEVLDDGAGGAAPTPGGGLEGLAERLQGLGGSLSVTSPPGGPTRVRAVLPPTV
ncbi:sensor histidine kinase [Salana multivorans]